ncbi:MAG: OmpH family outer membrane protein [Dysgonomonas sp.]|jgi:outer membrane protein|nr:OmpH family outer membrane protein [Prevotella sp.]
MKRLIFLAIALVSMNISFAQTMPDSGLLPIAYVDIDSLLTNYNFAKDANDTLIKQFNNSKTAIAQKQKQLEADVAEFHRKIQDNAFLSAERAEQEATRIRKLETDIQMMTLKSQEDFTIEQQRINKQITDSVKHILKEINKTSNYEMIFSNAGLDNILLAKDRYNITQKVTDLLNSRFKRKISE